MAIGKADFSNPYKLHTFAKRNISRAFADSTSGVLGQNSTSPQANIHRLGQASALKGHAYNIESYNILQAKLNKEQNAATHHMALPAREIANA